MSPLLMHASPLLYYFDPVSVEPPPEDDIDCAKDPRVQAKAAKMSSGESIMVLKNVLSLMSV